MDITVGKALGGIAALTGAAVMGVGLGGSKVAEMFPENAIGKAADSAANAVHSAGESAAKAVGLGEKVSGKTAAAVIGGALVAAGVTGILASRHDSKTDEEDAKERALAETAEVRRRILVQEAETGRDLNGDGAIGTLPNKPGSDRDR